MFSVWVIRFIKVSEDIKDLCDQLFPYGVERLLIVECFLVHFTLVHSCKVVVSIFHTIPPHPANFRIKHERNRGNTVVTIHYLLYAGSHICGWDLVGSPVCCKMNNKPAVQCERRTYLRRPCELKSEENKRLMFSATKAVCSSGCKLEGRRPRAVFVWVLRLFIMDDLFQPTWLMARNAFPEGLTSTAADVYWLSWFISGIASIAIPHLHFTKIKIITSPVPDFKYMLHCSV